MKRIICAFRQLRRDIYKNRMALSVILCYIIVAQYIWGTVCPMRIVAGLPCPACGLTRAGFSVLTGHIRRACEYNPMIFLWMFMIAWWILLHYFLDVSFQEDGNNRVRKKHPVFVFCMCICGILTIVFYLMMLGTKGILPHTNL